MRFLKLFNLRTLLKEIKTLNKLLFDYFFNKIKYPKQKCTGKEDHLIYLIPGLGYHPKYLSWLKCQIEKRGFHAHLAKPINPICFLDLKLTEGIKHLTILHKRDLENLLEKHPKAKNIVIIGHSLGGIIALFLLFLKKEKINHIITLGSPIAQGTKAAILFAKIFKTTYDLSPKNPFYQKIKRYIYKTKLNSKITSILGEKDVLVSKKEGVLPLTDYFLTKESHLKLIRSKEVLNKILFVLEKN